MIRVLVVDDSSFMRTALRHILESEESIEVVGSANDGIMAVREVKKKRPDVVLLDISMPRMNGLEALSQIMGECPTPVLVLSGLSDRDADVAIKSLNYGAVDFIAKPSGQISYDIDELTNKIISKVKIASRVNVAKLNFKHKEEEIQYRFKRQEVKRKELVIIGASTGGPRAISKILSDFPKELRASIIVAQHMAREFVLSFIQSLKSECDLDIKIAGRNEVIEEGRVFVAPGGHNTKIRGKGERKKIGFSRKQSYYGIFPSIDILMESAADAYGERVLGVLLTGAGNDGVFGIKAIKEAGGSTIAEDQSTAVVFGMPKAAIESGYVDEIFPLGLISTSILGKI